MINLLKKIMPKKKKAETIKLNLNAPNVSHTMPVEAPEVPVEPLEIIKVKYHGVEVLEVLNDGKETPTEYHCKLADGTTAHVPKSLFE